MTVDRTDPYAALGLTPSATQGEIRRAYLSLLRQNHPDTHPHGNPAEQAAATAALQEVIAAYATLGNPAARTLHDHRPSAPAPAPRAAASRPAPRPEDRRQDPRVDRREDPPIQAGPVHWHRSRP